MSTAGKVLVVLVTLTTLVWMVLLSMVAQLNRNYGADLKKQTQEVAKLQEDIVAARDQLLKMRASIAREQVATDLDLANVRSHLAKSEKALTLTVENQESIKHQLATYGQTVKAAVNGASERKAERLDTQNQLAEARGLVETIKGENDRLLQRLSSLREQFKSLLAENRRLIGRSSSSGRSASLRRPVPAP